MDSYAEGAVRAHNVSEAERIIRALVAALGLPTNREDLMLLKKGDRNKVICAAIAKDRTAAATIGSPDVSLWVILRMSARLFNGSGETKRNKGS